VNIGSVHSNSRSKHSEDRSIFPREVEGEQAAKPKAKSSPESDRERLLPVKIRVHYVNGDKQTLAYSKLSEAHSWADFYDSLNVVSHVEVLSLGN
jgi:hypothetical protein